MKKTGCVCRQVGFTLVELIVTITIMMVATMIGVVSFQLSSQKSRDGRRISDLEKIRIALEMYRQDSGVYPQTATVKSDLTNVSRQYMQAWPLDPKGSDLYVYSRGHFLYVYTGCPNGK